MKCKGFTLIEMLIVVAIIGILAALLIPNAMSALQKSKQKGTVKDINTIAAAFMDYVTDRGKAPENAQGQITSMTDPIVTDLQGFYLKVFPYRDQWGYGFWVYGGTNCSGNTFGITLPSGQTEWGVDDFIVGSTGRDGGPGPNTWDSQNLEANLYEVKKMDDFNNDIANWNGNLVMGPRTAAGTT